MKNAACFTRWMRPRLSGARWAGMLVILLMLGAGVPVGVGAQHAYINIKDPFIRKVPVAIPAFRPLAGTDEETRLGADAVRMMGAGLRFTGYMETMDPDRFRESPATTGIATADIDFEKWTATGAELLVTGGVAEQAGNIRLELRLFDPFKEKLVTGKVYTGRESDLRTMVHRFCGEISLSLTGHRGVFGSRIVFISRVAGNKEVFTSAFDGHNPQQWTFHENITLSPTLSSDGQWLAYTSYVNGKPDIFIENINTRVGTTVAYKGLNITPSWVPGKHQLVATLSMDGDQEIYLLSGKGAVLSRITESWGIDVSPRVSPDGRRIAFVSRRGGSPQIYVKQLDTGTVRRVTFQGGYNTSPAWSPDGTRLAYVGMADNNIDIYLTGLKGDGVQLTRNQGDNEDPSWSPDGNLIVFSSTREGAAKIYVMTARGTEQRRIVDLPGEQTDPEWSAGEK